MTTENTDTTTTEQAEYMPPETVEAQETALAMPLTLTAPDIFQTGPDTVPRLLDVVEKTALAVPVDITTIKGRKQERSKAATVARVKVHLDNLGKDLAKKISGDRKQITTTLDALKAKILDPVIEVEQGEAARVEAITARLKRWGEVSDGMQAQGNAITSVEVASFLDRLEAVKVTAEAFEEFEEPAKAEQARILAMWEDKLPSIIAAEEERAAKAEQQRKDAEELAEFRKQREEQAAKAAEDAEAEAKRIEAEERATSGPSYAAPSAPGSHRPPMPSATTTPIDPEPIKTPAPAPAAARLLMRDGFTEAQNVAGDKIACYLVAKFGLYGTQAVPMAAAMIAGEVPGVSVALD